MLFISITAFFSSDWSFFYILSCSSLKFSLCSSIISPNSVSILTNNALTSLASKRLTSISLVVLWRVFSCSSIETHSSVFSCYLFYLYEIRWNSYLWQSWRGTLKWEHPYALAVCPEAAVRELDLVWARHVFPQFPGSYHLGSRWPR